MDDPVQASPAGPTCKKSFSVVAEEENCRRQARIEERAQDDHIVGSMEMLLSIRRRGDHKDCNEEASVQEWAMVAVATENFGSRKSVCDA